MALRQDFAKQIEAQIAVWQAQIREHQEGMSKMSEDARAGSERAIKMMQENADQANKLLRQVQEANENAWKDMQSGTLKALEDLQKGWADALSRYS